MNGWGADSYGEQSYANELTRLALAEALAVSETFSQLVAFIRDYAETCNSVDTISNEAQPKLAETWLNTDSVNFDIASFLTESWVTSDAFSQMVQYYRDYAETWLTTDAISNEAQPKLSESWTSVDTLATITEFYRDFSETWLTTLALENMVQLATFETWLTSDTISNEAQAKFAEVLASVDALSNEPQPKLSEAWLTADTLSTMSAYTRFFNETLRLETVGGGYGSIAYGEDEPEPHIGIYVKFNVATVKSETFNVVDTVSNEGQPVLQETFNTNDTFDRIVQYYRDYEDGWLTLDEFTRIVVYNRDFAETWLSTDTVRFSAAKSLEDLINVSSDVLVVYFARLLAFRLDDRTYLSLVLSDFGTREYFTTIFTGTE